MIMSHRHALTFALASLLLASPSLSLAQAVAVPGPSVPLQGAAYGAVGQPAQAVDGSHGLPVQCLSGCAAPLVPANLATAQVSVGASATQVVASRSGRSLLSVENTSTTDVYCGPANTVTTANGLLLPGTKGSSFNVAYTAAMWCITASGSATLTAAETF